jgi:23S rRNA (cytidine1920-2'-O)/16S rRNA (cytidine1409-2'-O)-methyltransferase
MPFVSRAGEKLAFAIQKFGLSISGMVCADFGSSTGGFVDCLLQNGARKIYAVETGYGVLDWKLRNNERVIVKERTNAMHVTLPEKMDIITNDTSWTKQEIILPNIIRNLKQNGAIMTLIKPHYEADKKLLRHGVLSEEDAEQVTNATLSRIISLGLTVKGLVKSPIVGKKGGNSEYLAYLESTITDTV